MIALVGSQERPGRRAERAGHSLGGHSGSLAEVGWLHWSAPQVDLSSRGTAPMAHSHPGLALCHCGI